VSATATHCDLLVIGGGVSGCATAYELARRGVRATLLERSDLNTEASGRNSGSLHGQIQHEPFVELGEDWARRFIPGLLMLRRALRRWGSLSEELETDLEVVTRGGILVADSERQMADIARKVEIERGVGIESELLDRDRILELAPYLSDRVVGGELCPSEGKANPLLAAPAFAGAATRLGARVLTGTRVLGLDRDGAGFRVGTDRGAFAAERVVLCGGVQTAELAATLGVELCVGGSPVQASITEALEPTIGHLVYFAGEKLTVKQTSSGGVLVGGGWPSHPATAERPARVSLDSLRENLRVARHVIPVLGDARVYRTWAGVGNSTPDHLPLIGEVEPVPGLFVGTFPYMGFTAAPEVAAALADLVTGSAGEHDLAPFSPARFASASLRRRPR
jgi:glycine/D-amino acid oxidase-like deaminating enzyme